MPDLTKNQPGKLTILYWQPTSITESPNANAYQKPLGLALLGQVLMVCPRDAQIPDKIRRRVTIIPINTPLRGHWYTRFGSIGKVLLACRSVTEARAIDLVATRVEIPSLLVGLLVKRMIGCQWVVFCWDHPFGRLASSGNPLNRVLTWCLWRISGALLRQADRVVCNIDPLVLQPAHVAADRIKGFRNGVLWHELRQTVAGVQMCPGLVGVLTRLDVRKGVLFAVNMLGELRQRWPSARLRLIGELTRTEQDRVMRVIQQFGLAGCVEFTGWQPFEQAMRLAAECQVMVHCYPDTPQLRWNYVLKVGEAFAIGRPVVCLDRPGVRRLVHEGVNGFCAGIQTPFQMAQQVAHLLACPPVWQRMSAAAIVTGRRMSWDRKARLINFYLQGCLPAWALQAPLPKVTEHKDVRLSGSAQSLRLLWVQKRAITESWNATEVQIPLGLGRRNSLTILSPQDAVIPVEIAARTNLQRLRMKVPKRTMLSQLTWICQNWQLLRRENRRQPLHMVLTSVDTASLLLGFLTKAVLGCPWVFVCWDHPYGRHAEKSGFAPLFKTWMRSQFDGWFARRADLVVFNILPVVLHSWQIHPARIILAGNGVDLRMVQAAGGSEAFHSRMIGRVANVNAAKTPWFLLAVLAKVREQLPDVRLQLIGEVEASFRPVLQAGIAAAGLTDAVEITGWQPFQQAMQMAGACRVLVCDYPGNRRLRWNLVLKIGEYLALGRPVVATNLPGSRAMIREGETGFLVSPEHLDEAAARLYDLLTDDQLWTRMHDNALQVAARMDWSIILDRIQARLVALMEEKQ